MARKSSTNSESTLGFNDIIGIVLMGCALLLLVALLAAPVALGAALQRPQGGFFFREFEPRVDNPEYDGRFTFARLRYVSGPGGYYYRGLPAWAHGYVPAPGGASSSSLIARSGGPG